MNNALARAIEATAAAIASLSAPELVTFALAIRPMLPAMPAERAKPSPERSETYRRNALKRWGANSNANSNATACNGNAIALQPDAICKAIASDTPVAASMNSQTSATAADAIACVGGLGGNISSGSSSDPFPDIQISEPSGSESLSVDPSKRTEARAPGPIEPGRSNMLSLAAPSSDASPKAPSAEVRAAVAAVEDRYRAYGHTLRPSPRSLHRAHIRARVAEGWTAADLAAAVDGNHADAWHARVGKHDLSYVLRNSEQVAKFVDVARAGGSVDMAAERGRAEIIARFAEGGRQ